MSCLALARFLNKESLDEDNFMPEGLSTEKLIAPVPLEELSRQDVIEILQESKLFEGIDF